MSTVRSRSHVFACLLAIVLPGVASAQAPKRNYPYAELEGKAEEFSYTRNWRSYYWREDFTLLLRDGDGKVHRVISREPTPWNGYRLGTTYTSLKVDWASKPRVRIVGVRAIDRQPAEYYDLKLDPEKTITAFILQVRDKDTWKDFYVNNWFHDWGKETDHKILAHYANDSPYYTVYGYIHNNSIAAPFSKASQELLKKYEPDFQSVIYHGRVRRATNEVGYEVNLLHILGRGKKTSEVRIVHGDPADIVRLDNKAPAKK